MTWVLIALLGGSLVVSQHDTREACEGRLAVLQKDHQVSGRCEQIWPSANLTFSTSSTIAPGTITLSPSATIEGAR